MNRQRDGKSDSTSVRPPESVPEIGRLLRRARTRQGLGLEDVSARTGLPLDLLEALEAGTVARIPDSVTALKVLRRYADSVGLSGERFVLAMVEHWPVAASTPPPLAVRAPSGPPSVQMPPAEGNPGAPGNPAGEPTSVISRVPLAVPVPPSPNPYTAPPFTAPQALFTATGTGLEPRTAQVPAVSGIAGIAGAPTQMIVATSPGRRGAGGATGNRTPAYLRAAVVVLAVVVLAGLAVLVIHRYRPSVFGGDRPTSASIAAGGGGNGPGGKGTAASGTTTGSGGSGGAARGTAGTTGAVGTKPGTKPKAGSSGGGTTGPTGSEKSSAPVFSVASNVPTKPVFNVSAVTFEVEVVATGGAAWVEATEPQKSAPTFAGTLAPGRSDTATVTSVLTLTAGSVAAHVVVSVRGKVVGTYVPVAAPCTMTFRATPPT